MAHYYGTAPYVNGNGEMDWRLFTYERLRWAHGDERARQIALGNDRATQDDLRAWRNLGQRSAA